MNSNSARKTPRCKGATEAPDAARRNVLRRAAWVRTPPVLIGTPLIAVFALYATSFEVVGRDRSAWQDRIILAGAIGVTPEVAPNTPAPPVTAPTGPLVPAAAPADDTLGQLARKDFDRAVESATALIKKNPKDPTGYRLLAGAYAGKKDYVNARKNLEKALGFSPRNAEIAIDLARLDMEQGKVGEARKRYAALLKDDDANAAAMIGMAQVEARSGKEKASVDWLRRASAADPAAVAPRLYLADYYLRTRSFEPAIAELNAALQQSPGSTRILDMLGQAQLASGQNAAAVSTFSQLVSRAPNAPTAYFRLGTAQASVGDLASGGANLKKAIDLKPDYVEAFFALAFLEVKRGRPGDALELTHVLQRSSPGSPVGYMLEGDVQSALRRPSEALTAYEKAWAIRPDGVLAVRLHASRVAVGRAEEADAELARWLRLHPKDLDARRYLAADALKRSARKVATQQYEYITVIEPKNWIALNNLATLYQRDKDPRALLLARQAHQLAPDQSATADTLGWLLFERGDTKESLKLLESASQRDPENGDIRYHLAVALAKTGDKARARKELEQVLASDRAFAERGAARALLQGL
jgi:putative PEP-CTERM system TPR-repeat lipoprotein